MKNNPAAKMKNNPATETRREKITGRTRTSAAVIFTAALLLLAACGKNTEAAAAAESAETGQISAAAVSAEQDGTVRTTDMLGREIVLTEPVTRLVALTAADCEIVYALGAGDLLVGRGEYCDYPGETSDVPSVQSGYETNVEQILALAPQLVLIGDMDQPDEQFAQLEEAGVRVAVSNAKDIEGVYTSIRLIGSLLGKETEAEALIGSMEKTFMQIKADPLPAGSTVYFEVSPLEWGLWTAGKSTFMNEAAEMMGLVNCFDDVEGWAQISEEQVLERDPDLIVTISMYSGEGSTPEEEILSRGRWKEVTAVKNRAVLNLGNNELSRPGPRLAEGTEMLYKYASEILR